MGFSNEMIACVLSFPLPVLVCLIIDAVYLCVSTTDEWMERNNVGLQLEFNETTEIRRIVIAYFFFILTKNIISCEKKSNEFVFFNF